MTRVAYRRRRSSGWSRKLRNTKVRTITAYSLPSLILALAEDDAATARITAKNGLESYAYNLRNSLSNEKLASKFEPADKSKLESAVNEAITWLDDSQEASKDEYESKQK